MSHNEYTMIGLTSKIQATRMHQQTQAQHYHYLVYLLNLLHTASGLPLQIFFLPVYVCETYPFSWLDLLLTFMLRANKTKEVF